MSRSYKPDAVSGTSNASLELLFADLLNEQNKSSDDLPPVHLWNPDKSGDMDMRVDREGRWIHEGREIKRRPLVKLFSRIIKREAGLYYLVTPVEKWQIQVDVAPFFIISAQREMRHSRQAILLTTSTGESIVLGHDNPLWVEFEADSDAPTPLVKVRGNLTGLLSRGTYYQLVEWGQELQLDEGTPGLYVESMGQYFRLGSLE
ncbi:MAG: DUF1285 domain-containing protein [Porticoccaceae bacterium]|mgnify:CR=1 FL=1|jgi:uncharacterized protein|nr:DUF1285 domain-containing protein [Porticoccaceae bacterium]